MASSISFRGPNTGLQAGSINGAVNTTFNYYVPARPETPPSPSAVIPFGRDPDFVERSTILGRIQENCAVPGSRTALVGLGGVGKSQLAIEYAYRNRERSPRTWIFWAHASNITRLEQSYRDIADYVKIPGRDDPSADIFQLVCDWLRDPETGLWLLILDNVDDADYLCESYRGKDNAKDGPGSRGQRPLVSYIPQCPNGSVLITSRSRGEALKLVEPRDIIPVNPMNEEDALSLIEKKLGQHDNSNNLRALATALEFMPLAIVQAAAYIFRQAPRYSVQQYLEDFRENDCKRIALLSPENTQLRRDRDAKNSIMITWQMSFDHIREIRPTAAGLLSLMSFFDRQGIPENVLRVDDMDMRGRPDKSSRDGHSDPLANADNNAERDVEGKDLDDPFVEDILMLQDYSFISVNADRVSFGMHRLVQLAMRKWLEAHDQLGEWRQRFLGNLDKRFPAGSYETFPTCKALFPHIESAAAHKPDSDDALIIWASVIHKGSRYAMMMENLAKANELSIKAEEVRKNFLGPDHLDTLDCTEIQAIVYTARGRYDVAEGLQLQILESRKRQVGPNHPFTLDIMLGLAVTYFRSGRWEEAEKLQLCALETERKVLGDDHEFTAASMTHLASIYFNQGKLKAAEELEEQALEIQKKHLGEDHLRTLETMTRLACLYSSPDKLKTAEKLQIRTIQKYKELYGESNPRTLGIVKSLAWTYRCQARYKEAEQLLLQLLATAKKKFGPDYPVTLGIMLNLAEVYWCEGRRIRGRRLQRQMIESIKSKAADNLVLVDYMHNLGLQLINQGRPTQAIPAMRDCVFFRRLILGDEHPQTVNAATLLAYWEQLGRRQLRWNWCKVRLQYRIHTLLRNPHVEHSMRSELAHLCN